ncbi:MAG: lipoprotein [Betaproteobacteria bacterium AqS2]|uniref:Lipoprotein n=1 Tax=Candidatus Amphirhobacter heronislandensis TaxID=1732024 RepID=A0A930XWV0_9GAMM|nr:lipoprotein [Betaproteobacteria bacterium AqS2]
MRKTLTGLLRACALAAALALAGCGQHGPLELPPPAAESE